MRVLVTGATGFVAGHLLPALVAAGHEPVALGHDAARIPAVAGTTPLVVDLAQLAAGSPDAAAVLPAVDAVVHLAQANVPWPDRADTLFAVNTASTERLLDHARRCGAARFVYASSASVYGFADRTWSESDEPAARDFYSVTKRSGELLLAAYAGVLATTALRFVAPYGPGQVRRLVPSLIDRVRNGRAITLADGGRPRMNPVYVDDAVAAILRSLEAGPAVLNVAGDDVASIRDLGETIGAVLGVEPVFEAAPGGAAGDLVCTNDRLRALLGGRPLVPLREGIARTVAATLAEA